ncbi:hypothetical protein [Pseudomonas kilonensis]|uniref:hypothetical protein n=1 Tax=Pseudomonas kilonensis TaxID=132476 RepID=UPI000464D821|nr:hypothetical protein [Pseudomonas kilonensis]
MEKLLATSLKHIGSHNAPVMHTVEFQGELQHDTNFNNKNKARNESLAAAYIISNPDVCAKTVEVVSARLFEIVSCQDAGGNECVRKFFEFLEKDTGGVGQFGRVERGLAGISEALEVETDSVTLIQKMLIIKSFGAFVIDYASKSPADYGFLSVDENVSALVEKNKPVALFEVRGRSGVKAREHREDIGIMDKKEFDALESQEKEKLMVPGLAKERLTFRTFTHELDENNNRSVESVFVNRTFDSDAPLVASISGSTSCILVAADLLVPEMSEDQKKELALAAVGFLVGGGYHSATEVLDVACPGLDLERELNF